MPTVTTPFQEATTTGKLLGVAHVHTSFNFLTKHIRLTVHVKIQSYNDENQR